MIDRVVLVTKKTEYTELVERFGTPGQARFFITSSGGDFDAYEAAHKKYVEAADAIRQAMPGEVRLAEIERSFVASYLFDPSSLVVTLGPDGLVINVAKYLDGQPILAFAPERKRIKGVLSSQLPELAGNLLPMAIRNQLRIRKMTMAQANLNDGQKLVAANDLFIGPKSHTSARYKISAGKLHEEHSSSGIIVSTGVGSSGWYSSIMVGAMGMVHNSGGNEPPVDPSAFNFPWDADELRFSVREPFPSPTTGTKIIHGSVTPAAPLVLESLMPRDGVIFSDGIESDFLTFNAGAIATIGLCDRRATLLG